MKCASLPLSKGASGVSKEVGILFKVMDIRTEKASRPPTRLGEILLGFIQVASAKLCLVACHTQAIWVMFLGLFESEVLRVLHYLSPCSDRVVISAQPGRMLKSALYVCDISVESALDNVFLPAPTSQ